MCGLIAMIAKTKTGFSFKEKQMFSQMLYADALRGEDSTGVYGINEHGNLVAHKAAKHAHEFQQSKTYKDFEDNIFSDMTIVVGHNRSATKGAVEDKNAHPFIEQNICLVHNGTLHHHKGLADVEVDSHAICHAFAAKGHTDTLPIISGAFALIWYDAKVRKLHLARNNQRPLHMIETDTAFFIASESQMLVWLYSRVFGALPKDGVKYFEVDTVYTWDQQNLANGYVTEDFKKPAPPPPVLKGNVLTDFQKKQQSSQPSKISYKFGEKVIFEHTSNTIINGRVTFHGESYCTDAYAIIASMNLNDLPKLEMAELLDSMYIVGNYVGFSVKDGKYTLLVNELKCINLYDSINGYKVSERDLAEAGYCCHDCGTMIDLDEDDGLFWVRYNKQGEIKKIKCPTCVTATPQLQKELECTTNA